MHDKTGGPYDEERGREVLMQAWSAGLKALGWVVVALMVVAILYAAFISIRYWSGIGV